MQLYQTLYHILFNAATDALRALETGDAETASAILIRAQQRAEDVWVTAEEEPSP